MKIFKVFRILLALLIACNFASFSAASDNLEHIFKLYSNKTSTLCFKQTSINGMSGQKIIRDGKLTINAKKNMVFDYKNEKVIINDFEAIDYVHSKKYIYKLSGFNRVLFLLFLGKEDVNRLFSIRFKGKEYVLTPKYKSNIDKVYAYFKNDSQIDNMTISDIYSNKTIYQFYAPPCKRTQSGN